MKVLTATFGGGSKRRGEFLEDMVPLFTIKVIEQPKRRLARRFK